jgi:oleate hydratase
VNKPIKAYRVGAGIGSLAAAAFMIRDGKIPGTDISVLEAAAVLGGSLDAAGDAAMSPAPRAAC